MQDTQFIIHMKVYLSLLTLSINQGSSTLACDQFLVGGGLYVCDRRSLINVDPSFN